MSIQKRQRGPGFLLIAAMVLLICFSGSAQAQRLWGPSSYDECVAAELAKHQNPREVYRVVQRACERRFETRLNNPQVDIIWGYPREVARGDWVARLNIRENLSDFEITKATLRFFEEPCESPTPDSGVVVTADFSSRWPRGRAVLETEVKLPFQPQCMETFEYFGKRVK